MKLFTQTITIALLAISSIQPVYAQQYNSGIVNFNANPSPIAGIERHKVSLYGCNTKIDTVVDWGKDNQVLAFVPFAEQKTADTNKSYYVSKYYLVSPPVPLPTPKSSEPTNIGLLTPDNFTFKGNKPSQIVNLDYNILQPTYFQFISIDIDNTDCQSPKLAEIPINIHCPNFPWFNGAQGASGIGVIKNITNQSNVFMATLDKLGNNPLQCTVTLLDDILLEHQVFFNLKGNKTKTINLTEFYNNHSKTEKIPLVCKPRGPNERPAGCKSDKNRGSNQTG